MNGRNKFLFTSKTSFSFEKNIVISSIFEKLGKIQRLILLSERLLAEMIEKMFEIFCINQQPFKSIKREN